MKVSKGQSKAQVAAAAFLIIYMDLGRPLQYRVLSMTHIWIVLLSNG